MNEIKEGYDYRYITESSESGMIDIELTNGKYEGIIYRYGKVTIEEDEKNDQAYLTFMFEIVDSKNHKNLEEDMEFKTHIGEILNGIVAKSVAVYDEEPTIEEVYEN